MMSSRENVSKMLAAEFTVAGAGQPKEPVALSEHESVTFAKTSLSAAVNTIEQILEGLNAVQRLRVLKAVIALYGYEGEFE